MNENKILSPEDYVEPVCPLCMKDPYKKPDNDTPKGSIPVERIIQRIDASFEKGDIHEALRVLEYWLGEARQLNDKKGELSVLSELIGAYRKLDNEEKALACVNDATSIIAHFGGDLSVSYATIYLNCATALKAFGKALEAIPIYEKVLESYGKYLPAEDSRFGGLYNNMALALVDLERYGEAEDMYFKAIGVMQRAKNGEAEIAITYLNLAHMYEDCGMPEKIQCCLDKAYSCLMTESLPKNGHYAYVCQTCAPSFEYFGMKNEADTLTKTAGDIYADA